MLSLVDLDLEAGSPKDCIVDNQEHVLPTKSSIFTDDKFEEECSKLFTVINFFRVCVDLRKLKFSFKSIIRYGVASSKSLVLCQNRVITENFAAPMQGLLGALWLYMVYAMIRTTIKHYNEEGFALLIVVQALLLVIVTPYFGIMAKILQDCEKKGSDPPDEE